MQIEDYVEEMEKTGEKLSAKPCSFTIIYYQYSNILWIRMDMKDTAVGLRLMEPDLTSEEIADLPLSQPLPISREFFVCMLTYYVNTKIHELLSIILHPHFTQRQKKKNLRFSPNSDRYDGELSSDMC